MTQYVAANWYVTLHRRRCFLQANALSGKEVPYRHGIRINKQCFAYRKATFPLSESANRICKIIAELPSESGKLEPIIGTEAYLGQKSAREASPGHFLGHSDSRSYSLNNSSIAVVFN